jgi:superkiller protein 3
MKLERYQETIKNFDRLIQMKPDSCEAWLKRGDALEKLGRYEEAICSYGVALEIKPDYYEAMVSRAQLKVKGVLTIK